MVLHVEGAYNEAEVYVNGQKLFYNHYGYQPFKVDITKHLKFSNKDNVIDWLKKYDGKTPLSAHYQWVTYNPTK